MLSFIVSMMTSVSSHAVDTAGITWQESVPPQYFFFVWRRWKTIITPLLTSESWIICSLHIYLSFPMVWCFENLLEIKLDETSETHCTLLFIYCNFGICYANAICRFGNDPNFSPYTCASIVELVLSMICTKHVLALSKHDCKFPAAYFSLKFTCSKHELALSIHFRNVPWVHA